MEERRIYCVVTGTIQVPVTPNSHKPPLRTVVQPAGRQIAQACHAVSKLRYADTARQPTVITMSGFVNSVNNGVFHPAPAFVPFTTIILQARDSAEMGHVHTLLRRRKLNPVIFSDDNPEYGPGNFPTAVAVFATPKQVKYILDYLPLWGAK